SVPDFAAIVDNMLFVIIGGSVYQVHDEYIRDEIYRTEPVLIRARMRMGVILRGLQTLIKAAFASFCSPPSSSAGLRLRGFTLPLRGGGRRDFAAGEPSAGIYASADARPLFPNNGVTTARQRCVVRGWAVTPELEITGGAFSIHTAGLETVEA
ncbi:MAG: hypothetical protein IJR68_10705, partial [Fretibacterium sp.]|nr:hypothetical protein [Fretibacterium sp.]